MGTLLVKFLEQYREDYAEYWEKLLEYQKTDSYQAYKEEVSRLVLLYGFCMLFFFLIWRTMPGKFGGNISWALLGYPFKRDPNQSTME